MNQQKQLACLLSILMILSLSGCTSNSKDSNENEPASSSETTLDSSSKSSKIEVIDDFQNRTEFDYGNDGTTDNSIELSDKIILDNIKIYETTEPPEYDDIDFDDNNEEYGDNIIHSSDKLDVLYEIYQWALNNLANDGFSRLSTAIEEQARPDIPINDGIGVEAWASMLSRSLEKTQTYSILINTNYKEYTTLIEKWNELESKLSDKVGIISTLKNTDDIKRLYKELELSDCSALSYAFAEEVYKILNDNSYISKRNESLSIGNITEEEQEELNREIENTSEENTDEDTSKDNNTDEDNIGEGEDNTREDEVGVIE